MMDPSKEYSIVIHDDPPKAVLQGVMRLASPAAYDEIFGDLQGRIQSSMRFTIDISGVLFMNSAGIASLSRLVLIGRRDNKEITLEVSDAVPWQKKTVLSLQRLYSNLQIQNRH